jgi:cell division cycle protein 20 (cofactor of APC complex)
LLAAYAKGTYNGGKSGGGGAGNAAAAASQRRRIATAPERVLDAPGLVDDYYLNLLDWSADNLVAIALGESVYVWNAETGEVGSLCSVAAAETGNGATGATDDYVCSVRFSEDGSYLAVGTSSGRIQIYDVGSRSRVRTMAGHLSRVPTLSWSGAVLSSGARDGAIWNSDVRVAQHKVSEMKAHRAEVCGLEWRRDPVGGLASGGQGVSDKSFLFLGNREFMLTCVHACVRALRGEQLLASGGNDNVVNVWDGRNPSTPRMTKTNHTAAVKALAWCPWSSNVLATGGGSSDKSASLPHPFIALAFC